MEATPWEKIEVERMNDKITRQMMSGENTTLARVLLTRGAIVPRHFHVNEQFTMILEGCLKFTFDDGKQVLVRAGELLYIPPNMPHAAEALEDTVDIDFFCPRREDWINKKDDYLRSGRPMQQK